MHTKENASLYFNTFETENRFNNPRTDNLFRFGLDPGWFNYIVLILKKDTSM